MNVPIKIVFSSCSIIANLTEYFNSCIPDVAKLKRISISRVGGIYRCYLPRQLQKNEQEILAYLQQQSKCGDFLQFEVVLSSSGYLDFCLYNSSLTFWLNKLPTYLPHLVYHYSVQEEIDFFLHYVHARCHAIVRLAKQERFVEDNFYLTEVDWCELDSTWERRFFWQLLEMTESSTIGQKNLLKIAQATLDVERHCRIWGDIYKINSLLAQKRLLLFVLASCILNESAKKIFQQELLTIL